MFPTDLVAQRGEMLELLIDKMENLVGSVSHILIYYNYSTILLLLFL